MILHPVLQPVLRPVLRGPFERPITKSLDQRVQDMFANNEQGWWYDPSDLSTLYQDAAGTMPVTAMEQTVGLMLDKSKGLVLGPELVTNGDFSDGLTGWSNISAAPGTATVADGRLRIYSPAGEVAGVRCSLANTVAFCRVEFDVVSIAGTGYVSIPPGTSGNPSRFDFSTPGRKIVYLRSTELVPSFTIARAGTCDITIDNISIRELPGNHGFQTTLTKRMKVSRRVNLLVGTAALATQNTPTVAGAHTLKFTGAGSVTLSGTATGTYTAGTHSITCTAGTLTLTVAGAVNDADFRLSIDNHLPFQWVNTATDYDDDPAKFPTYLQGDGIDDCFVTNNIDLTGTDKINVWAGITKLSDATAAIAVELGSNVNGVDGTFNLSAPPATVPRLSFSSRGTISVVAQTFNDVAPISRIMAGIGDISGDVSTLLLNGTQAAQSTADQGTGNYGNLPLNIGARNQTSLFFGGKIYPMLGRGALSNASQHAAVNTYIKQRMMLP